MNTSFYYQKERYPTQSIKELLKPVIDRASKKSKSNNQIKLK